MEYVSLGSELRALLSVHGQYSRVFTFNDIEPHPLSIFAPELVLHPVPVNIHFYYREFGTNSFERYPYLIIIKSYVTAFRITISVDTKYFNSPLDFSSLTFSDETCNDDQQEDNKKNEASYYSLVS